MLAARPLLGIWGRAKEITWLHRMTMKAPWPYPQIWDDWPPGFRTS